MSILFSEERKFGGFLLIIISFFVTGFFSGFNGFFPSTQTNLEDNSSVVVGFVFGEVFETGFPLLMSTISCKEPYVEALVLGESLSVTLVLTFSYWKLCYASVNSPPPSLLHINYYNLSTVSVLMFA